MDAGKWIPIDKHLMYYLPKDRPYTMLEAMFSYTLDQDNGKEISINGYSRMWDWSRNKVRRFLHDMKYTGFHLPENAQISKDRDGTGTRQVIRFVNNKLPMGKDRLRTGSGLQL